MGTEPDSSWTARGVCLGAASMAVLCAVLASRLEVRASFLALLPDDSPLAREVREVSERAGGSAQILVVWHGPELARRQAARQLVETLRKDERFMAADCRAPVEFLRDRWIHLLDDAELASLQEELREAIDGELERSGPFNLGLDDAGDPWQPLRERLDRAHGVRGVDDDGWFEPEAGATTYALVRPRAPMGELARARRALSAVRAAAQREARARPHVRFELAGQLPLAVAEEERVGRDATRALLWAVGLIILTMVVISRRISALWVVGVPLSLALLITLAGAQLWIGHLNILSAFMVPAVAGLGVDFCIHVYLHHLLAEQRGDTPSEARRAARRATWRPSWVSALTTAAGFACLGLSASPGVREYAWVACMGLAGALATAFVLLPQLASLARARGSSPPRVPHIPVPRPVAIAGTALVAVLVVAAALPASRVRFANDFDRLQGNSAAAERYRELARNLGGPVEVTVLLARDLAHARRIQARLDTLKDGDDAPLPNVSLASFLPRDPAESQRAQRRMREDLARLPAARVPEEHQAMYERARRALRSEPWELRDLPASLRRGLLTSHGEPIVLLQRGGMYHTDREISTWVARVQGVVDEVATEGPAAPWMDVGRVTTWVVEHVSAELPRLLGLSIGAVALLLWLGLGRLSSVALVLVPVAGAFLLTLGALEVLGIGLNLYNALVLPSIVGIGVDDAVHLLHARRQGQGMPEVWRERGAAVLLSSLTTGFGFGTMAVAQHGGLFSMGVTALLGIASVLACTLALAAALWISEGRVERRSLRSGTG